VLCPYFQTTDGVGYPVVLQVSITVSSTYLLTISPIPVLTIIGGSVKSNLSGAKRNSQIKNVLAYDGNRYFSHVYAIAIICFTSVHT
jgi:hypothetical protein